jgi:hypothetical protein
VAWFEKSRIEKSITDRACLCRTGRPLALIKNNQLIIEPRIEFWAFTGRAFGTFPKLDSFQKAPKVRSVPAPNSIWGII